MDIRDNLIVHDQVRRIKRAMELWCRYCSADPAIERAMTADFIRQLMLDPLEIDVLRCHYHIQLQLLIDRAIEHHIDHRRIRMEVLQTQQTIFQEIITIHTG